MEDGRKPTSEVEATRHGGFSLLEMVLVLAIIATLTAIAAPRYQTALVRYRADLAARRIIADLALAQSNAKAGSSSRSVVFSVAADNYQMPDLSPLDGTSGIYQVNLSEKPYEADIISADFGADDQIIFDGWGLPDSGGTLVLTVGPEQRTVTVDAETGKTK
ncbi:MAG: GspH/FimT family pseudopilin, partial [Sedimentisphaerales bacterium]